MFGSAPVEEPHSVYLVDMVELEMLEQQKHEGRDSFHNYLFVSVDINA